jgi:hypothetical protein
MSANFMAKEREMSVREHRIPVLLWPFWAVWRLVGLILEATGRLVAVVMGLALMIVGIVICLTVIGAVVGIPLALIGVLLVVRGIF